MVHLNSLEKFILALAPNDARLPISRKFDEFVENNLQVICSGISLYQTYFHPDENDKVKHVAVNSMMIGIFLARASEDPEMQTVLENFVDQYGRMKGENIIDFLTEKAQKRGK